MTKPGNLHSAPSWDSTPLICSSRRIEIHPPTRQTSGLANLMIEQTGRLACPECPHATRQCHRDARPCRAPFANPVSSLRRVDQRDQSEVGFAFITEPEPTPLSSPRAALVRSRSKKSQSDAIIKTGGDGLLKLFVRIYHPLIAEIKLK